MQRADFYILAGDDARERWKFACREIEKAFAADETVLVWCESPADAAAIDELLWTFADRSFVPHEPVGADSAWEETPVLISAAAPPPSPPQVIVNLSSGLPPGLDAAGRAVEIIDADPARRQAGRVRFRKYRELGVEPTTHNVPAP